MNKYNYLIDELHILDDEIISYGKDKFKLELKFTRKIKRIKHLGKLILVTAINPTSSGEGKTTLSIGLALPRV